MPMRRLYYFALISFVAACGGKTTLSDFTEAGGSNNGAQGGDGGNSGSGAYGGNGAQGGSGAYGGSGAQGGMPSCNDGGEGTCDDCQAVEFNYGGCCEREATMCVDEPQCLDFIDCINLCYDQDPSPESCVNTCVDKLPRGYDIYLMLVDCAFGTGPRNPGACGFACNAY